MEMERRRHRHFVTYPALLTMFPLFSSFTGIPSPHPIHLMCTIESLSILS